MSEASPGRVGASSVMDAFASKSCRRCYRTEEHDDADVQPVCITDRSGGAFIPFCEKCLAAFLRQSCIRCGDRPDGGPYEHHIHIGDEKLPLCRGCRNILVFGGNQ